MKQIYAFILLMLLVPTTVTAQFFVRKGTKVAINTTLTSKEKSNTINSNIKGTGVLLLASNSSSTKEQQLQTRKDVIIYTDLTIQNANATAITSSLKLAGSLNVHSGILNLTHPIRLKRHLNTGVSAMVFGLFNVLSFDNVDAFSTSALASQRYSVPNSVVAITSIVSAYQDLSVTDNDNLEYFNTMSTQFNILPQEPPPKIV